MRYPASEKAEIIELVEQSHLPAKRWTSSVYREPHSIAGMIVTVRAALKHWPIIGRGRTGSGTGSRTMSAARSSIWRCCEARQSARSEAVHG